MAKRGGKVTKITATVTDKSRPDYGETYTVRTTQGKRGELKQEYVNKEGRVVQTTNIEGGQKTVTTAGDSSGDNQLVEAGVRAGQSPDTVFKTESGQGFSADPQEVQRLRNEYDARQQSVAPQVAQNRNVEYKTFNTAYGGNYIPQESRSGDIDRPKTNVDVFIGNLGETYEDVNRQVSTGIVRPAIDVIGRFPRYGGGGSQPLVNVPMVESVGYEAKNYISNRPLDIASNVYLGYGVGRLAKIPFIAGVVSRPSVKAISYGAYGLSAGGRVISGEPLSRVIAEEGVNLGAFSFGLSGGLKTSSYPLAKVYPRVEPKVSRIEANRYTSDAVAFDANIVTPKGSLESGRFTTRTAGLYKVGKKYYAVKAEEFGTTLKQSDILDELVSSGKIKIQTFKYIPASNTLKASVGRPQTASINTRALSLNLDEGSKVSSYSQIVGRNFRFSRVTNANIKVSDLDYSIRGVSVDVKGGEYVLGSKNIIAGRGSVILQSTGVTPYGEPYTLTKTSGFSVGGSRNLFPKIMPKNNLKAYNREQFVQGARQSLGLATTNAYSPTVQLSNTQTESLVKNVYAMDVGKDYAKSVSKVRLAPTIARIEQPKIIESRETKYIQKSYTIPKQVLKVDNKLETRQISGNTQTFKSFNTQGTRQYQNLNNDTLLKQAQAVDQTQLQKQATLTKQVTRQRTRSIYPTIPLPKIPFLNIPRLSIGFYGGRESSYKVYRNNFRSGKLSVFAIPDLLSVSQTEQLSYARYGKGEAISPRLTSSVREATINAFSGRGLGRIPTLQQQKNKKLYGGL